MAEHSGYENNVPANNDSHWPSSVRFAKTLTPDEITWLSDHPEVEFTTDPKRNTEILEGYLYDSYKDTSSEYRLEGCVEPGILSMRGSEGCWHAAARTPDCSCSCHKRADQIL